MGIFRKRKRNHEIAPDEIFLDSRNLPEFNVHQFEGRIERPISERSVFALGIVFLLLILVFAWRLAGLQVVEGEYYAKRSENNSLRHTPIFPERGVIYDRNGTLLAWNTSAEDKDFAGRAYNSLPGLAHLLGYISYPQKDTSGVYFQKEYVGKAGVEDTYNTLLAGEQGVKITEVDVFGKVQSESVIAPSGDGANITLSIDAEVQNKMYEYIKDLAGEIGFQGGAGVIMNVHTGEILAITSFPEYDPNVLSTGEDRSEIAKYVNDQRTPFLNRAVSGLYTPGSTVKPFFGIAALNEHLITPEKKILSTGSISIQNPYFPDLKTVFNDWKAHGWVALRDALAVSSNVYFFEVGGGYEDQPGLGIERLERYARLFGLGEKTGVDIPGEVDGIIPNPAWKAENFDGDDWRIGDTYNTAIGQYGFQITSIQLARAVAVIASDGQKTTPHVFLSASDSTNETNQSEKEFIDIEQENFAVVREGMRQGVTSGISQALNIGGVSVAAKTGTAEVGAAKKYANSWITGFFPYENPQYAFAVVMEKGPRSNLKGAVFVMRNLLTWMAAERPEYVK